MSIFPTKQIILIECRTGCSCCSYDNHYRGPYEDKESAERRIKFFLTEPNFCPLGSQYAARGRYSIREEIIEILPDGRWICGDRVHNADELRPAIIIDETGAIPNVKTQDLDFLCHYLGSENPKETGYEILCFLEEHPKLLPRMICITSRNPSGVQKMEGMLKKYYDKCGPLWCKI